MERAKRKDVAQLAGVSETIVSYVVNQNRYVSEDKKKRVLEAMQQLNYTPNRFARALKGKKGKHIVMLIDRIHTEAYGELISDIERFSGDLGYLISVSIVKDTMEYINSVLAWQVDGIIIGSGNLSDVYIQRLVDFGMPVILMENRRYPEVSRAIMLNTGLYEGTQKSVRYLFDSGCTDIVYVDRVSVRSRFSNQMDYRYAGYCAEIKKIGQEPRIISGCHDLTELQDKLITEMRLNRFDGVFARNDEIASVVMNTLMRKGYRIPEDVSVIGVDDTVYSRISNPTLSTLRQPREEIAKAAVQILEKYYQGEKIEHNLQFEAKLILRDSVKERVNRQSPKE